MVRWGLTQLQVDLHHVTVALDCALTDRIVVAGALVHVLRWLHALRNWLEVDHWHVHVQLHDLRFAESALLFIPLGTFEIESTDVGSILGAVHELVNSLGLWNEIELKTINRWAISLSGESLQQGSRETVGEGECTDPEGRLRTRGDPLLEEGVPLAQVLLPVGQWLRAEVGARPLGRHSVLREGNHHLLELG